MLAVMFGEVGLSRAGISGSGKGRSVTGIVLGFLSFIAAIGIIVTVAFLVKGIGVSGPVTSEDWP